MSNGQEAIWYEYYEDIVITVGIWQRGEMKVAVPGEKEERDVKRKAER